MSGKTYSVSEILLYYFNIYPLSNLVISKKNYIGMFIHKLLSLYYKYNNEFNGLTFLNTYSNIFNNDEKNKILDLTNKLKDILKKKKWEILFFEQNFFYNNLYGKPDAIYTYNKNLSLNFFSSLLVKYFYNIKSSCINKNFFLNSIKKKEYIEDKNNIILIDWKCSNRNIFLHECSLTNNFLKKNFYNTLYNKFLIQMNIYKYILEKNNYKVIEMYVCLMNIDNSNIDFIPIYCLDNKFIENIINNFLEKKKIN